MQYTLVLDKNKQPLAPCHPARSRQLLRDGKAAVFRRFPFTIILKEREGGETQPTQIKLDPGSKTTGIAVVQANKRGNRVVWAGELHHRGETIKSDLESRRAIRRGRRNRKTRYRQPRFLNRTRPKGWLPPSLMSRVYNIKTMVTRLCKFTPASYLAQELVRFDTQIMENPNISGIEYQQGTLYGYEVREYLLERDGRKCAYCGAKDTLLEIEHIIPKSRGGHNRVTNLTLACRPCNQKKGSQTASEFGYSNIQAKVKRGLRDVAAVNSTRWKLYEVLQSFGFELEVGTGGRTKYNRTKQGYPKTHWLDATCVGESGEHVFVHNRIIPLQIHAKGHGSRQMCRVNKYGFPRTKPKHRVKRIKGFQTGDMVRANVPSGKKQGVHEGRVAVRATGSCNITTDTSVVQGINTKYLTMLHMSDGYSYLY